MPPQQRTQVVYRRSQAGYRHDNVADLTADFHTCSSAVRAHRNTEGGEYHVGGRRDNGYRGDFLLEDRTASIWRPERILVIHIAKTAGTSISRMLYDEYGPRVQFITANIADFPARILRADGVCDPHQVEIVDDTVVARTLPRLETLDFVGLTERFDESCAAFDSRFLTGNSHLIRLEGVHRPEGRELSEHTPRIDSFVTRDRILCETAVARLNADSDDSSPP